MKKPTLTEVPSVNAYKKVLVHGPSGAGKTRFASTFPKPVFLDIEGGTSSIDKSLGVQVISKEQLNSRHAVSEIIDWLFTSEADQFETVVIDSLTHLQNVSLNEDKGIPNQMQAYGNWIKWLRENGDKLFSLKKNVVIIARSKSGEDIEGAEQLIPELSPGAFSLIPALVDYALVVAKKTSGLGANKKVETKLYTLHPRYYTKVRGEVPVELEPTFDAFNNALKSN